jgi:hypothetical protein
MAVLAGKDSKNKMFGGLYCYIFLLWPTGSFFHWIFHYAMVKLLPQYVQHNIYVMLLDRDEKQEAVWCFSKCYSTSLPKCKITSVHLAFAVPQCCNYLKKTGMQLKKKIVLQNHHFDSFRNGVIMIIFHCYLVTLYWINLKGYL